MQFSRLGFMCSVFFTLSLFSLITLNTSGQIVIDIAQSNQDLTYFGASRGDALSPIAVGDFNGDGVKDILLGAPNANGKLGERGAGAAYIILGPLPESSPRSASNVDLEAVGARITIFGCNVGDQLGTAVAAGVRWEIRPLC
ncbi:FG-GAP repeat protein [Candidatus Acetothermia bacterium]|nr:FG-GAP repeat protein [Candidatus Acetothermia bacterium]